MEVKQTGIKSKRKRPLFYIFLFSFFFFFAKRPTWQRFCISDLPSACQPSSSGNIAKKHKNKLLAIAAVPMGTGPQRVCPLRHSSAQIAREPHSPATRSCHLHCGAGSGGGLLPEPAISAERLVVKSATWGGGRIEIPGMMGQRCSFAQLPPLNKEHTFPAAGAAPGRTELQFKASWSRRRAGRDVNSRSLTGKTINKQMPACLN